jgi:hypothetical protein
MKLFTSSLIAFLFLSFSSFSQLSIVSSDMPSAGDTFRVSTSNTLIFFDPNATGSSYQWDFSELEASSQLIDTFIAFNEVPANFLFFFFGKSNLAEKAPPALPSIVNDSFPSSPGYNFFMNSSDRFSMAGQGYMIQGIPIPVLFDNPDVLYEFPLLMDKRDTSYTEFAIIIPGIGGIYTRLTRFNHVDGSGTLITPLDTFQTLRVRSEIHRVDSISLSGINQVISSESIEYKWLAKNEGVPVLQINTQVIMNNEVPTLIRYKDKYRKENTSTGLEPGNEGPGWKAYPGILRPGATLHIETPGQRDALELRIVGINGTEVLHTRIGGSDKYLIPIPEYLKSGIYLLHITDSRQTYTQKIMILRP